MKSSFVTTERITLSNHKGLIFDMDGVIIDSESLHILADKMVCQRYRLPVPNKFWENNKGRMAKDLFKMLLWNYPEKNFNLDELVEQKNKLFLDLAAKRLWPITGAIPFLARARSADLPIALATSSNSDLQTLVFKKFGLASYFDEIVTGDQVRRLKPDPETYLVASERLGLKTHECLVIEDSKIGVKAAKKAGCTVIGITTTFSASELLNVGAHHSVDSFSEIDLKKAPPIGNPSWFGFQEIQPV